MLLEVGRQAYWKVKSEGYSRTCNTYYFMSGLIHMTSSTGKKYWLRLPVIHIKQKDCTHTKEKLPTFFMVAMDLVTIDCHVHEWCLHNLMFAPPFHFQDKHIRLTSYNWRFQMSTNLVYMVRDFDLLDVHVPSLMQ